MRIVVRESFLKESEVDYGTKVSKKFFIIEYPSCIELGLSSGL